MRWSRSPGKAESLVVKPATPNRISATPTIALNWIPTRPSLNVTRLENHRKGSSEDQVLERDLREVVSRSLVEEMEGVELTGMEKQSPPLLTEDEKRILDVYDRLEELRLDIALLKAQGVLSQGELPYS
jgi:hypothetical protein